MIELPQMYSLACAIIVIMTHGTFNSPHKIVTITMSPSMTPFAVVVVVAFGVCWC